MVELSSAEGIVELSSAEGIGLSGKHQERWVLAINPGSTSTKVGVFAEETLVFSTNVEHAARELEQFTDMADQAPYRKEAITSALLNAEIALEGIDAFSGRGGVGCYPMEGGVYAINELMLKHCFTGHCAKHASNLGSLIIHEFSTAYGKPAYIVNSTVTDEFEEVARITGIKNVYRKSMVHTLNMKEMAIRHAASQGKSYEEMNFVVAHLGGGISVAAHKKGRAIDGSDALSGDGPMAPNRSGAVPLMPIIDMCFTKGATRGGVLSLVASNGGLLDHLGTMDVRDVKKMIKDGDRHAALIFEAMIYQIGKTIGSYAAVLRGEVDAIIITGGIAKDVCLVEKLTEMIKWIAPVHAYPGEFELEALAAGVIRAMDGKEEVKVYTGKPVWDGFREE